MKRDLSFCLQLAAILAAFVPLAAAQTEPPIVRPGPPGGATKVISPDEAADLSDLRYSAADVRFMQEMISHHAQALKMTGLAAERGEKDAVRNLAKELSGTLEADVTLMKEWLTARGQKIEAAAAQDVRFIPGMATAEDMSKLEQAKGVEVDREFLALIIQNQRGATTMAEELLANTVIEGYDIRVLS
jgi:uncharacterized protein (DUF305 family)